MEFVLFVVGAIALLAFFITTWTISTISDNIKAIRKMLEDKK